MPLTTTLIAAALQVGPNPSALPPVNPHDDLRDRPQRTGPQRTGPLTDEEPDNPTSKWLAECLTQLETDPARAHSQAQIRLTEAASAADRVIAQHCRGLAATELGLWDDAYEAFIAARDAAPDDELRARARFGIMAGNAALAQTLWTEAFNTLRAARIDARTAASAPLQAAALRDMARALVAIDQPESALSDLEEATILAPEDSEAWLLKATLLRRLDRLAEAQTAIERAAALAPVKADMNGEIGLEAGVIAVMAGRDDAARQSWQSVIDTLPESPFAKTAKGYLAQIGPAETPVPSASDTPADTASPSIPYELPGR